MYRIPKFISSISKILRSKLFSLHLKHVFLSRWSSKGIPFHTFVLILQDENNSCVCSGGHLYMKVSIFCILSNPIPSHCILFHSILFIPILSHPILPISHSVTLTWYPIPHRPVLSYPILSQPFPIPSHVILSHPLF